MGSENCEGVDADFIGMINLPAKPAWYQEGWRQQCRYQLRVHSVGPGDERVQDVTGTTMTQ